MKIPFMKVPIYKNEREYLLKAFDSGFHHGGGPNTQECQKYINNIFKIKKTLLTTSCTDALEMAALLLDCKPGDEIIFPSYTFSSTVNAFAMHGFTPVYVDIRLDTLNIDESKIEAAITEKTKAIVPIHYAGIPAEMDTIMEIAERHGITVVEDAAQAVNSQYKEKFAGAIADLGTFSFHATKSYSCGEGGALLLNNEKYFERSEFLWEKGTDRSLVIKGLKNKYSWVDYGSSFLPSDLLAAILLAQLENKDEMQVLRKKLHDAYSNFFNFYNEKGIRMTTIPDEIKSNYHAFWVIFPESEMRDKFIELNLERDVSSYIGYIPLHNSPMGKKLGGNKYNLENTEYVAERIVRLPFYLMNDNEIDYVLSTFQKTLSSVFK